MVSQAPPARSAAAATPPPMSRPRRDGPGEAAGAGASSSAARMSAALSAVTSSDSGAVAGSGAGSSGVFGAFGVGGRGHGCLLGRCWVGASAGGGAVRLEAVARRVSRIVLARAAAAVAGAPRRTREKAARRGGGIGVGGLQRLTDGASQSLTAATHSGAAHDRGHRGAAGGDEGLGDACHGRHPTPRTRGGPTPSHMPCITRTVGRSRLGAEGVVEITIQYCDESETLGAVAAGHPRTIRDAPNISPESGEKREGLRPGSRPPPP